MMRKEDMIEPFRLCGNLYFVGALPASSHLIDTGAGLLLLDTGYPEMANLVWANIRKLGFDPMNLRWILHSHGHIDHLGATRELAARTGAKTYIGAPDADAARGWDDLAYAKELGMPYEGAFEPDTLLKDGDELNFGNTAVTCLSTPGHTRGTMSYFWNAGDLVCATHGGSGMNTLSRAYLNAYRLPIALRADFLAGIKRLRGYACDVFVGNHAHQNDTKRRQETGASFVDAGAWGRYLDDTERAARAFFASDP